MGEVQMSVIKVLFLDDEPVLGECFSDEFASTDIEIMTFTDPKKVIEQCAQINPDVVFVDFRMPGLTGDAVAKALPKEIPKYLITGELEPKVDYQFNQILKKPYEYEKIHLILKNILEQKSKSHSVHSG